jgi:hypothetical protein
MIVMLRSDIAFTLSSDFIEPLGVFNSYLCVQVIKQNRI